MHSFGSKIILAIHIECSRGEGTDKVFMQVIELKAINIFLSLGMTNYLY